jgi:molybdopterin converting factor small subunit
MTPVRVEVRLKGALADRVPGGRIEVDVEDGAAVESLIVALDLPAATYIYAINGAATSRGAALHDGDRVQVYPPMAGG